MSTSIGQMHLWETFPAWVLLLCFPLLTGLLPMVTLAAMSLTSPYQWRLPGASLKLLSIWTLVFFDVWKSDFDES